MSWQLALAVGVGFVLGQLVTRVAPAVQPVKGPSTTAPKESDKKNDDKVNTDDGEDDDEEEEEEEEEEELEADPALAAKVDNESSYLNDDFKLVLVIRADLPMGKGKVAAQCSHATLAAYKQALRTHPKALRNWERSGQAKITLKCNSEEEMLELQAKAVSLGLVARSIQDAGRTQIAAGSRTVLAIGPGPVNRINEVTGSLKLY